MDRKTAGALLDLVFGKDGPGELIPSWAVHEAGLQTNSAAQRRSSMPLVVSRGDENDWLQRCGNGTFFKPQANAVSCTSPCGLWIPPDALSNVIDPLHYRVCGTPGGAARMMVRWPLRRAGFVCSDRRPAFCAGLGRLLTPSRLCSGCGQRHAGIQRAPPTRGPFHVLCAIYASRLDGLPLPAPASWAWALCVAENPRWNHACRCRRRGPHTCSS
jgi:hypothetical protein